jgi:ribonuclease BN (tRNA processing enzyme)
MKLTLTGCGHGTATPEFASTSMLLEAGNKYYLVDAADGTAYKLICRGLAPAQLSAVMITHTHLDHTAGLPEVIRLGMKGKKNFPEIGSTYLLADIACAEVIRSWIALNGYKGTEDLKFASVADGYADDVLKMRSIKTGHLMPASDKSYSLIVEAENKKIFFSGDLRADFSDFSVENADGSDLAVVELTHYPIAKAIPFLEKIRVGKLVFNHRGGFYQREEGIAATLEACAKLPYPVILGTDGMEIEI